MENAHQLWIHDKDMSRFRKYTPLQVRPYKPGSKIYTASFRSADVLSPLRKGFVFGELVTVGDPADRGVLFTGNTQYNNGLIISNSRPVRGNRDFVSLNGSPEEDFMVKVFRTYFSVDVAKARGNADGFDSRLVIHLPMNAQFRKRV